MVLAEKYKRTVATSELGETGVSEHLFPAYDASLWRVRVPVSISSVYRHMLTPDGIALQVSKEAYFVRLAQEQSDITNAFERSAFIPGSIYVEGSFQNVASAVLGMDIRRPIELIPIEERPMLYKLGSINADLGHWVRVQGKGLYGRDLAHVLEVNPSGQEATVLLVPRISSEGKRKLNSRTRPSPFIFNPEGKGTVEHLQSGRVRFNKKTFYQGLLELTLPLTKLRAAHPSAAELEVFALSGAIRESVITRAFSDCAAASVVPGHRVRITSGEQTGIIGTVSDVGDGVVKCVSESAPGTAIDVPVACVRLHLEIGDYVQVLMGADIGKHGGIIKVERAIDTDVVTFTDDMSIKSGQPQQVSFRAVLHDFGSSTIIFFRSLCQYSSSRSAIGPSNQDFSPTQMFQRRKNLFSLTEERT
jgi:hypothetical protein